MDGEPFRGRTSEFRQDMDWLASEDIIGCGDVEVAIKDVERHKKIVFDDGSTRENALVLVFEGKHKRLVLNPTNRKTVVLKMRTNDVKEWIGKKITLYVDHNVRKPGGKRGEKTCGIRVRAT